LGDPQRIEELRGEYAAAFDPDLTNAPTTIDLGTPDYVDLARRIRGHLRQHDVDAVAIRYHGELLGVATRRSVGEGDETLANAEVSSGDRATLPGESGQYRAIRYRCRAGCHEELAVFHDARFVPECPAAEGERMEWAWI
jgi:hypothetical protein